MYKTFALFLFLMAGTACFAQYQLLNPGFESWEGTSATSRPSHWSSFPQADGSWAWAASTAQHYHRNGGRPGTTGSSYLTIYSRSVLGVVANGNMTTGQIHAGSTSASSSSNYNYTHRGSAYCHTFRGTPDSMYVWVSYYASSASSQGSVRAYLHGDSDFRDPNDCGTSGSYRGKAVAQFSRTTSSASTPSWVQHRVPFTYDGTSSVNYVLMSMTTNTTPGGGSANDSLSVDDIEFIYSAWLDNIALNGNPLDGFQRDVFDYAVALASPADLHSATLAFTPQANDATVTVDTLTPNDTTLQYVLNVLAEDTLTTRTYTVTLTCPNPPCGMVEGLAVVVEDTCVVVSWNADLGGQPSDVEVLLVRDTDTIADTVTQQQGIIFCGLQRGVDYTVFARMICDPAHQGDWVQTSFSVPNGTEGIAPASSHSTFRLFPNPAQGQASCQLPDGAAKDAELTIYDVMGRVVLRQHLTSSSQPISLADLPAGLYTVTLQTGGSKSTQRLSVLR